MNTKSEIVIHHSGIVTNKPQIEAVNSYHKKRGFPLSELKWNVGYHYFLDTDRQLYQTREDWEEGAHTRVEGSDIHWNQVSIGICIAGDFTQEEPKDWQIEILAKLVRRLQLLYSIPNENIWLHRELKSTLCPGADWKRLIAMVTLEEPTYLKIIQKRALERLMARLATLPHDVYLRALKRLKSRFNSIS